ncbi:uncharacterized protein LOC108043141 [Drosophila rhopaloa]|uniref:DUF4806 domain-containing protein n=1 Tax=Drosophila rhopaloa TaxID=1041015 RepID=A0ABM5HAJ9_DRORH|nr:uncharacterized protein LOC108043141 [Drosophila rhopaloa]
MTALTNAVGTLTAYVRQSGWSESSTFEKMQELFLIDSDEKLMEVESRLILETEKYQKYMLRVLGQQKLRRTLTNVLTAEMMRNYNLDGSQQKKKLKSFPNFFQSLLNAIGHVEPREPEKVLTKAMRCLKNLHAVKKKVPKKDESPGTSKDPGTSNDPSTSVAPKIPNTLETTKISYWN